MFELLKQFFAGSARPYETVTAYWCCSSIKLPNKLNTPSGSKVSVVTVCVDVDYSLKGEDIHVKGVRLSKGGGRIMGASAAINVAAERTGEAWYTRSLCSASLLRDVVLKELDLKDSSLRRIMAARWRHSHPKEFIYSIVGALNSHASPDKLDLLLNRGWRPHRINFIYTKPSKPGELREVTIKGVAGDSIRALDHKDGKVKYFRLDRISCAHIA